NGENWYDYEYYVEGIKGPVKRESYWRDAEKKGVDRGEKSRIAYAFHVIAGHHGVFSLTPVWLLSVAGIWLLWRQRRGLDQGMQVLGVEDSAQAAKRNSLSVGPDLAIFVAAITSVCLVFYLLRPIEDRNYGGVSAGFRWMFWFAPLWLVTMLPAT